MALFSKELGIDLGTMYIRVVEGGQVVLQEPTVVAIVVQEQKMVAWGREALDMLGRVPDSIEVTRPMRSGVIADYEVAEYILRYLLRKVAGPMQVLRPQIMMTVPDGATSVWWVQKMARFSNFPCDEQIGTFEICYLVASNHDANKPWDIRALSAILLPNQG